MTPNDAVNHANRTIALIVLFGEVGAFDEQQAAERQQLHVLERARYLLPIGKQ